MLQVFDHLKEVDIRVLKGEGILDRALGIRRVFTFATCMTVNGSDGSDSQTLLSQTES